MRQKITHTCDVYSNELNRERADVRYKSEGEHDRNWLSEQAINSFIRIVISQANRFHDPHKMYSHLSSQMLPLFEVNGRSALYGQRDGHTGVVKEKPIKVSIVFKDYRF